MIGFIGCGNMASAVINGLIASQFIKNSDIGVFDIDKNKTRALEKTHGVKVFESTEQLIQQCEKVVLAVKPNIIFNVIEDNADALKKSNPLIISIAAGKTLGEITVHLPYEAKLVRIMPNINAKVQSAVSAFCFNEKVNEEEKGFVQSFCDSFGKGIGIDENLFSIYSSIGACSPAFVYMFIDSMARAAVKNGMTKKQALQVCAQAVLGSAQMILSSDTHPWQLVDEVCSPGGTTIQGVASLQKDGFENAVINAVEASYNKDLLL